MLTTGFPPIAGRLWPGIFSWAQLSSFRRPIVKDAGPKWAARTWRLWCSRLRRYDCSRQAHPKGTAMRAQAAAMKALLDKPGLLVMPGCGDGMGARLIEEAGFPTAFISGSSVSAMRLAMPDMDLVGFAEMADAVETCIAAAPKVLWLADGDTGHGNALAVQKVIRAYARRGAAAVLIEDKIWPRPLGHSGAKLVVDREHAILRCRAAVEACRDEGILLLARTSRGFDEALARIQAFTAEGADILFLDSPQSEDEMRTGIAACDGKPAL